MHFSFKFFKVLNGIFELQFEKMKPGLQKGRPVIVQYSLPIIFQVQEDEEPQNKNN